MWFGWRPWQRPPASTAWSAPPQETGAIRQALGEGFLLATPGGSATDDQQRIKAPGDAIRGSSSFLVVGRPITAAPDPMASLEAIRREVEEALAG